MQREREEETKKQITAQQRIKKIGKSLICLSPFKCGRVDFSTRIISISEIWYRFVSVGCLALVATVIAPPKPLPLSTKSSHRNEILMNHLFTFLPAWVQIFEWTISIIRQLIIFIGSAYVKCTMSVICWPFRQGINWIWWNVAGGLPVSGENHNQIV